MADIIVICPECEHEQDEDDDNDVFVCDLCGLIFQGDPPCPSQE